MESEPRIAKNNDHNKIASRGMINVFELNWRKKNELNYKCHYCCICMNYRGKMMEDQDGKKVSLHSFLADLPEDGECVEKMHFGAAYSISSKFLLVARPTLTMGLQKCL